MWCDLPWQQRTLVQSTAQVLVIASAMPAMLVVLAVVAFGYYRVQHGYRPTSRDSKVSADACRGRVAYCAAVACPA